MKDKKRILALGLAGSLLISGEAMAGSPEFARSEDEWAKLRDDVLEYDEIEDLIHEYNATVIKNQLDLNDFHKDYGETNDEWADRYRELADDLEDSLNYPDVEDSDYATTMSTIVTNEMQIETWREAADDALEDYMTYYLNYTATEKTLASTAQSDMVSYYLQQLQLETDVKSRELLEETYENIQIKRDLGSATEAEVLLAKEDLLAADKTIQDDESAIETLREQMIVLMGWSHDAQPEIREIPEIDFDHIAAMDPEADKEAALENNYTLRVNKRKLENATEEDTIDTLKTSIRENEQMIGASLLSGYRAVLANQAAYELAQSQAELEERNLATAERQYALGNLSRMEYLTQKNTTENAQIAVETARLDLFQAVQDYDWAVNGLASA